MARRDEARIGPIAMALRGTWVLILAAVLAACGTEKVCPTGTEGSPCLPVGDAGSRPEIPRRPDAGGDTTTDPDVSVDGDGDDITTDTEPLDILDIHPDGPADEDVDAPADVQESAALTPGRRTADDHPETMVTRWGTPTLHRDADRRGVHPPPGRARPARTPAA
ncbi:MAG: hypothetical protein ACQEXJ_13620 [Myxococcota bacterium]